jgi:hypothetical protein
MTTYTADIEADGFAPDYTKIWCATFEELDEDLKSLRKFTLTDSDKIAEMFTNPDNTLVMHNGLSYDGPAVSTLCGVDVKAKIIDTLMLSWYLFPMRHNHGLKHWGEDLDIAKIGVEDWEGQPLEVYIERCEVDVDIQTALWRHMMKTMKAMYKDQPSFMQHAINHVNLKGKMLALQEKSKWKIDVVKCQELYDKFDTLHEEARTALEQNMPEVAVTAKRTRPAKPFKKNGELSAHGEKWVQLVQEHGPIIAPEKRIDFDQEIIVVTGYRPPKATSPAQVKDWLFSLGWEPETFAYKAVEGSKEKRKIPQVRNADSGELCPSIERMIPKNPELKYLKEISVISHRRGMCKGLLKAVDERGFIQARAQGFTNTLRLKHASPAVNLPSGRKPYGADIRGLFMARSDDTELCGSDMSSLEDRTKQHYMMPHDPEYVKSMMSDDFDPHLDMAIEAGMMTHAEAEHYKALKSGGDMSPEDKKWFSEKDELRHGGKTANYACTYGASGETIARQTGLSPMTGEKLFNAYWKRNWALEAIAAEQTVVQRGKLKWMWNPVMGMYVWLKKEKDIFSTLNQSTGAYCFDRWLFYVTEQRNQLTAQFHDEGVWELRKGNRDAMIKILKSSMASVNKELGLRRDMDCDVDFAQTYAGVH